MAKSSDYALISTDDPQPLLSDVLDEQSQDRLVLRPKKGFLYFKISIVLGLILSNICSIALATAFLTWSGKCSLSLKPQLGWNYTTRKNPLLKEVSYYCKLSYYKTFSSIFSKARLNRL
jgi:hypothetical protein